MHGNMGNDLMRGQGGYDRLWGNDDNDDLVGEHLNGGSGTDSCRQFVFAVHCES